MDRVKNSVGIRTFGGNATRFMPAGYHPDTIEEDMVSIAVKIDDKALMQA